ncbi:MAG: YafY family protein [Bacteroidota bacterium]
MNRVDRLMGHITMLQAKKHVTAEQMAEQFGISVRTVYRDLRALSEIGVPVGFEAGKGYYIVKGYFLPPVSLTPEEANALTLVESIVRRFADRSIHRHYETALSKIKNTLGGSLKERVEQLQSQTGIYQPTHIPCGYQNQFDAGFLSEIQQSIVQKNVLRIEYENLQTEHSLREVEPIGLIFYSLNWHLIAWCWKRREYRDFRTSRILKLTNTQLPFRKNDHIELQEYLQTMHENTEMTLT